MAVRAADGPPAGFKRQQIDLVRTAPRRRTPPARRTMRSRQTGWRTATRMTTSREVKPSNCSTPAIWVTAATVEASTRKRYSQRRGAISGTAAVYYGRHQLSGHANQRHEQRGKRCGRASRAPGTGRSWAADSAAACRNSFLQPGPQIRETGNPSVNPKFAAHPTFVMKRDNAAKSWIVLCNSGARALCLSATRLNFSMIAASSDSPRHEFSHMIELGPTPAAGRLVGQPAAAAGALQRWRCAVGHPFGAAQGFQFRIAGGARQKKRQPAL